MLNKIKGMGKCLNLFLLDSIKAHIYHNRVAVVLPERT